MNNRVPSLTRLNSAQARTQSRQAMDSGWTAWLVRELKRHAEQKFEAASANDVEALRDARMIYSAANIVDSIIRSNAK